MIAAQVLTVAVVVFHLIRAVRTMNSLTDFLGGISYHGHFAQTVTEALRLVYQRGVFDGFVAGALLVLMLKRERSK